MLTQQEMTCTQCGALDRTTLKMQTDRRTGKVRFAVECDGCGNFSHFVGGAFGAAVRAWLETPDNFAKWQRRERT